jgi:hypothetical protein
MDIAAVDLADPDDRLGPDTELGRDQPEVLDDGLAILTDRTPKVQLAVRRSARTPEAIGKGEADIAKNLVIPEHAQSLPAGNTPDVEKPPIIPRAAK